MIQCDDVKLSFAGEILFEGVSFLLGKKERTGFVGRNGSGKSTLFKVLSGEITPDGGKISFPKDYKLGVLQQHIAFSKETIFEEGCSALKSEDKDYPYKAEKVLFGLGFTKEDMEKSPKVLSGGFALRLHLAKVLIAEPDCLLLDEPTNYLDILSIRWLKNVLKRWPGEIILISHDREFMDAISTHTMGLHRKKMHKVKGSTIDYFKKLLFDEDVYERTRQKEEKKRAHQMSYVERFGSKATKARQAQSRLKMLAREPVLEKLNALKSLSFSFHEKDFPGKKMMEARNLYFSYTEKPLIEKFSLEIGKKEKIAIIGKNGRGKSTILKLLMEEIKAASGTLKTADHAHIGYFGQTHIDRLHPGLTVEEEIKNANPNLKFSEVKGICGLMLFSGELSKKKIEMLSGGEKSRVLLGKILAKPCNLLFLDEPTHHLDIESIEALIDALEEFSGSLVLVTHSELILRRLHLDKVVVCEEKKQTVLHGSYDDFLEKLGWEEEKRTVKKKPDDERKEEKRRERKWKKKIEAVEEKITSLEKKQKEAEHLIEKGEETKELLEEYGKRSHEIERLFQELESIYEEGVNGSS